MQDPLEFYNQGIKEHGGVLGARSQYYGDFMQKYFAPTPQMETMKQLAAFKHLIPGKIYTYQYSPSGGAGPLGWYDTRPMIISIRHYTSPHTKNHIEFGLNLNFMPPKMKQIVIQRLYQTYQGIIDANMRLNELGNYTQNRPTFTGTHDFMKVLDFLWDSVGKTAYKFALRNYIYPNMSNIKTIDYADWGKILFIEPKDVTGASIGKIYKQYYQYKLNITKGTKKNKQNSRK